eukprot:101326_1
MLTLILVVYSQFFGFSFSLICASQQLLGEPLFSFLSFSFAAHNAQMLAFSCTFHCLSAICSISFNFSPVASMKTMVFYLFRPGTETNYSQHRDLNNFIF